MTINEKVIMLKSLLKMTNADDESVLKTYLDFTKRELIAWRYGGTTHPPIARAFDSEDNPVFITVGMFIAALSPVSGTSYVFTYSELAKSWQYEIESIDTNIELADYGLSVNGTPIDTETITVKYTETPIAEYDTIIISACMAGYGLQGLENQISSSENGISRTFKYPDMVAYIHAHVPAYCGVI